MKQLLSLLTGGAQQLGLELPAHGVGLPEADDDGGEDGLGAEDEAVDEAGDEDHYPAPASLGVVVLLESPQLSQLLLVSWCRGSPHLSVTGDDDLDTVRLVLDLAGAGGVRLAWQDPTS